MIHELGREITTELAAQGCPFVVVDREPKKPTAWRSGVIVIDETGDKFLPAASQSSNPKRYYQNAIGVTLTVFARSAQPSAKEFEHKRVARRAADLALVALRKACAVRKIGLNIDGGGFIPIDDLEKSEVLGGAVYELAFTVARGVFDRTWAGAAAAEATLGDFAHQTLFSQSNGPDDDDNPNTPPATAEVACGE